MSKFKPGNESQIVRDRPRMPAREVRSMQAAGLQATSVLDAPAPEVDMDGEESGGAQKVALGVTLLFIFLRFSFLHELLTEKLGIDLHLMMILGGFAFLAALLSGHLFIGLGNRISLAWFAFAACMCFSTAFSSWKGGSFSVLFPYLRTTMILVVLIPAIVQSPKSLMLLMKTIGLAGLGVILLGLTVNDFRSGRLELSNAGASIENSNDYAAIVILVMPAIAYAMIRRGTNPLFKVIGVGALGLGCFLVLSTGSRGALVSMCISLLYLLKVGSGKVRAAILIGIPLLALATIPFLPAQASTRLASIFSSKLATSESAESQMQRTALLMESLRFTLQHPLLGVGPGTFEYYQADQAGKIGQRGMWHETHNSYTQVSSECGIPAIVFYLAAIGMTFAVFKRGRKSGNADVRSVSTLLALMLVSFCVCMFFLSQAYGFAFPVMGGVAVSIDRLLKREGEQEA